MARLDELIVRIRRRWFTSVALRVTGLAAAAAAVPVLAGVLADLVLRPEGFPLLGLAAATIVLALAAAAVVIVRIERRPDDRRVARFIEERAERLPGVGALDDAVVSAVDAGRSQPPAPIAALIVNAAMRRLEGVTPEQLVPAADLQRAAAVAVCGLAALSAVIVVGRPSLSRAAETARVRLFPDSVAVEVTPGSTRIVAGRPLTVRATVRTGARTLERLQAELIVSSGAEQRTVPMTKAGDGFEFAFESVDRSFTYRVRASSAASDEYSVTALFPPRVERIDLLYQYPSFSGLPARHDEDGGDIYAPAGTRVRLRVHTDKPVVSGQLAMAGGAVTLRNSGDRTVDTELVLKRDDSYRVRLTDRDGLMSDGDSEYFIRLMDDRPPDVRILRPSSDQGITPLEEVTVEARADDDYGISAFELVFSVAGGPERSVQFSSLAGTPIQKTGSLMLAAEELKVKPGDVISYYARARDVGRGKRPTETRSDIFFLEVKPFTEEFVAAQSQAGGGAPGDPQLDSLISAQKEIISATWNLERRSEGGRSAEDVAALAKAQAELKARVERMSQSQGGRRFRDPAPQRVMQQRPGAQPSGEGLTAAIEAMARAAEQLGAQRTKDALPHEMAALNGLLQAQAEVRRRQVTQQANSSGSGGGNRSGQDLSALFDKELQRQQRTNYEQRSQVEARRDENSSNDDLLERIKELARRQEEVNRRQQELEKLAAEERKRELDKLSREQEELRRQADQLARQSGAQSSLRDAARQMGNAASGMQREDANGARESGQRAADQLRRAEEQARRGNPQGQERAAGELKSEAQQIAQEQRRIASEAERLDKEGGGSADARKRLASEKERLADRVDQLQREARAVGATPPSSEQASAARQAAADLEKQRVSERMRESAKQMRGGAGDSKASRAEAEQQIARALDGVVDKLGGAGSEDGRRLSQELERTRQLRQKLDALERQMKAAQGKNPAEAAKLQQQYQEEMRNARASLGRGEGSPTDGRGTSTPERHEFSQSAPGTEAFKQDRSDWESLRKDLNRAIEQHDVAVSRRLAGKTGESRFSAGGSDRVPDEYRRFIAKYYESLAKVKK